MKAAELLEREPHRRLTVRFRGHVGLDEAPVELARELLARLGLQVGDDHFRAVLRRHARRGCTQSGSAAGDEKYGVLDLHESST
jgi:hypothetical protein